MTPNTPATPPRQEAGDQVVAGFWECPECRCQSFAKIWQSSDIRCVNCKRVWPGVVPTPTVAEAPDGESDAAKPQIPAHDYAARWARDTLGGREDRGRFPWGERNLAASYLDACSTIARLEAERDADGWMPIETAPNDGKDIHVYCASTGEQFVAFWSGKLWCFATTEEGCAICCEPTHWRPLPNSPALKTGAPR